MNERDLGAKLKRNLDASLENLPPRVLDRLRTARETAVERARQTQGAHGFVRSGSSTRFLGDHGFVPGVRRYWMPVVALVVGLAIVGYWHAATGQPETEDLELLAGELPLNAYLDRGFDQWLTSPSRR
ncbi:MAG: DUF3619 family protein [Betaproteobacteria bacterium]